MVKAIIFDMDGVIVDTVIIHNLAEQKVFKDIGISMTIEEVRSYAGPPNRVWFAEVLRKNNNPIDVDELVRRKHELMHRMLEDRVPVMPGFLELSESLKRNGMKTAIASGSDRSFVDFIVSKLKIEFDAVVSNEDISNSKPDPAIFLAASKKLGVSPGDCIVIEDASNGVAAARKAGMKCIGLINKNSGKQDLSQADLIIDTLDELSLDKLAEIDKRPSISATAENKIKEAMEKKKVRV